MARVRMTLSPAATPPEGTLRVIEVPVEALVFVPRVLTKPIEGQTGGGPPTQTPPLHVSFVVQALPSSRGRGLFAWGQPEAGWQGWVLQTVPAAEVGGGPAAQPPPLQASAEVQALPSLQGRVLFTWAQPVAGLQESSVHGLPSLQLTGEPVQVPPLHVSPEVQALPSL